MHEIVQQPNVYVLNRLGIQEDLHRQIDMLEREEQQLLAQVQSLRQQKLDLETRLEAHQLRCPSTSFSLITSDSPMPLLTDDFSTSITTEQVDKIADLHLDDCSIDSYPLLQTPQNPLYDSAATTLTPNCDLDMFFMDP